MNTNTIENLQSLLLTLIKIRPLEKAPIEIKSQYSFHPDTITLSYLIKYADWNIQSSKTIRRNKILKRPRYALKMSQQGTFLDLAEYNTQIAHQMFAAISKRTKVKQ